jgi:hypothetical protein
LSALDGRAVIPPQTGHSLMQKSKVLHQAGQ